MVNGCYSWQPKLHKADLVAVGALSIEHVDPWYISGFLSREWKRNGLCH